MTDKFGNELQVGDFVARSMGSCKSSHILDTLYRVIGFNEKTQQVYLMAWTELDWGELKSSENRSDFEEACINPSKYVQTHSRSGYKAARPYCSGVVKTYPPKE